MKQYLGIIPSRYASTRFPGKPLALIRNKPMIQWVYERAVEALENVVVATDDDNIFSTVKSFGGNVVMTSIHHKSGTDRCKEALENFEKENGNKFGVVINIQGDEPFIKKEQIELLKSCFNNKETQIATLIKKIDNNEVIFDRNRPKVVIDKNLNALYFSRSPIPFLRGHDKNHWLGNGVFYQHIGMYAYKTNVLSEITNLPQSNLEKSESLEQLRWLENGYNIKTALTEFESFGIDTPEDLANAIKTNLF